MSWSDPLVADQLARANHGAGQLRSYGFQVSTTTGVRRLEYLVARCYTGAAGDLAATTVTLLLAPAPLRGTWIRIDESPSRRECEIRTFLPTMARPLLIRPAQHADCLPLTDIGYLDVMAWPHPDLPPAGTPAHAGLSVVERRDQQHRHVLTREVWRDGHQLRCWQFLTAGEPACPGLAHRMRVRRAGGHESLFVRSGAPAPLPAAVLPVDRDESPVAALLEWQP